MMESGPIFIGGPDRCGKTTMSAFLTSHPRLSIPAVGSNMWTYFYGQFGDLRRRENFDRCLDALLHYKHVRFLQPDPQRIRREFWQGAPTYGRLFALIHQHHAEREGKPRWGDQTGLIERYADQVFREFPTAKMLHMIRDPRDRYHASLTLWPNGKGRVGGATARWLYSIAFARRNLRKYPGRYKVVQFETLVCEPEQTLRDVCGFLGEAYVPTMLTMEGDPERRARLTRGAAVLPGTSPLSEAFIGLYRQAVDEQAIPRQEIAFMQGVAGKEMVNFGYSLDAIHLSPSEGMKYVCFDWPANLTRMIAWLSVEFIQHYAPGRFGRKPDPRTTLKERGKYSKRILTEKL